MKKRPGEQRGAMDLLEEAVHVLRRAPLKLLVYYWAGTFPFLLGFLYFWADMSRGPFAHQHVGEAALAVSLLYIWMKTWQALFCQQLQSHLLGLEMQSISFRRMVRIAATQSILQPYSMFMLPFALLVLLPFGWVFAFFQNVLVIGDGRDLDLRRIIKTSWRLALIWPAQNHRILLIVFFFGLIVFLNVGVAIILIPSLMKTLLGFETIFTLSGMAIFNTTYLTVVAALTYLLVDPIITVVYTLRCFYGAAIKTGADLISDLKRLPKAS